MTYPGNITGHVLIGTVSDDMVLSTGFPLVGPLSSPLSAPGKPGLFERFPGTMGPSDFPCPSIVGVRPKASRRGPPISYVAVTQGISRVPCRLLPYMPGVSDCARSRRVSRYRRAGCGLPHLLTASAPRNSLSRLNTRPARSPVNASPRPCGSSRHDSGPLGLAKPLTYETCIHYNLPA